jgi:hypothetical protein
MKDFELLSFTTQILDGLIDSNINVVSLACDGTEVERSVQRLLIQKAQRTVIKTIENPITNAPATCVTWIEYRGRMIAIMQDSKHGLKTFRNNLLSGSRFPVFGNGMTTYQHIRQIAFEEGSPIYHRDVDSKLDRQDDNAAARLFSSAVIQYLARHHPEYIGEIVYLFVFGELIDAYQNRHISHFERVKMILRARYFLDAWALFHRLGSYRPETYGLSREALDICRILIEGYLSLIYIHRDHIPCSHYSLLPWLHSTEPCEHTFGNARRIVKDFTMLDFIYMVPKLRIHMREQVLRARVSSARAVAAGYNHTYFSSADLDLLALARLPSDDDIHAAAISASQECITLVQILGVDALLLYSPRVSIPSISSWYDGPVIDDSDPLCDDDSCSIFSEDSNDADELQDILNGLDAGAAGHSNNSGYLRPISYHPSLQGKIDELACAAAAVTVCEMSRM